MIPPDWSGKGNTSEFKKWFNGEKVIFIAAGETKNNCQCEHKLCNAIYEFLFGIGEDSSNW